MNTLGILLLGLISINSLAARTDIEGRMLRPAFQTAPSCQDKPEFLNEIRGGFASGLGSLPETVLVAREAEFYVEGSEKGTPLKLHGFQSFLSGESKGSEVLCGNAAPGLKERFVLFAPTLIDTFKQPRVGQSLWQFQLMTEGNKYSSWNMKTPSYKQSETLEDYLKSSGATYKLFQKAHDEYELLLTKKSDGFTQYLSIIYDAVPRLK